MGTCTASYVGSMDGRLYAVEAATGKSRFTFETEGSALDSEKEGYDRTSITSSPAVSEDGVFFGSRDGHLYGVDQRWISCRDRPRSGG